MSQKNLILNNIFSPKGANNLSFSGYNLIKQSNKSLNQTNLDLNKSTSEKDRTNINLNIPMIKNNNKSLLFLKKLNIKDNKNKYYIKALNNLFYNPKHFLNDKYEGKDVIIGKKNSKNKGIKELYEYYFLQNKIKKSASNKNELKSLNIFQKTLIKTKNKQQQSFLDETITNKTFLPMNVSKDAKNYPVSDNELKLIYKEMTEREKKNRIKNIKLFSSPKKLLNQTQRIGIERMLNLQEKILDIKDKRNQINQIISDKIISCTFKARNKILMNQKKNLIILKGKNLDSELTKFKSNTINFNDIMKNWIYKFRKYENEENKNKMHTPQEYIYNNNGDNSFQCEKKNNIRKLFLKNNFLNELNDDNNNSNNDLNSSNNKLLCIEGKNLLKEEIKISKELFGKKKKIYKYYFSPSEISPLFLARSYSIDKIKGPKTVMNSMEVHKLP